MYYRYEDIIRMMETNKPKNPFALKNNYDTTQKKWKKEDTILEQFYS